jgi:DNA-directed RNA polymerase subunit RPC12/RpoP
MTIREYITRRVWKIALIALVPFLILQLLVKPQSHWQYLPHVTLAYFLVAVVWVAVSVRRIRCPRCSQPLGAASTAVANNRKRFNKCPHCGIGLDERMESLANQV